MRDLHINTEVNVLDYAKLLSKFREIILKEEVMSGNNWSGLATREDELYDVSYRLIEIADQNLLPRSYISRYHLNASKIAYASIGAHTNLMTALLDMALDFTCTDCTVESKYGYTYREFMEAARRHDLPENVIGDIPDDGRRDEAAKNNEEIEYWVKYSASSPLRAKDFENHVLNLLVDMTTRRTTAGTILYLADKFSSIIEVLSYDRHFSSPVMAFTDKDISDPDKEAMHRCDNQEFGYCKASEMWTISLMSKRKLTKLDQTGFFTSIIVMTTLLSNDLNWYKWREEEYLI